MVKEGSIPSDVKKNNDRGEPIRMVPLLGFDLPAGTAS